jgi:hypothetical protein
MAANGRIYIDECADHLYLLALGMTQNAGHQRHLLLPFFAHPVSGFFPDLIVIFVG